MSGRSIRAGTRAASSAGTRRVMQALLQRDCGPLPELQKLDHIYELDAVVAHLYGLKEKHLVHIFETFHEGWDYTERLAATRKHYQAWKNQA